MLSVVFVVLPLTAGSLIWSSYRRERARVASGQAYSRPGAIRWTPTDHEQGMG